MTIAKHVATRRLVTVLTLAAAGAPALVGVTALAGTPAWAGGGSGATTYFLDCAHGADSASGLSPQAPWRTLAKADSVPYRPGDHLLVRRGTRCDGVFSPTGSGTTSAPVVVDAYGSGPLPQIAGDGVAVTVLLHDVQGWELRHLDISDQGLPPRQGQLRTAIDIENDSLGVARHFVIADDRVHDVNSSPVAPTPGITLPDSLGTAEGVPGNVAGQVEGDENYAKVSGGIELGSSDGNGFDDVLIAGNQLTSVDREGMYLTASQPTTALVVRDNTLRDIGGDGIVAVNSAGALIEHNVVRGFNMEGTSFNAGVWAYASSNAVFQFNDVSYGQHGPLDTMAYDVDGSNFNLLFQYNLSHDNTGGFLMLCNNVSFGGGGAPNGGSVIRYNISQNDSAVVRGVIDDPTLCAGESDISVYNNTVFTKDPRVTTLVENTNGTTVTFANNILEGPGIESGIFDDTYDPSAQGYLIQTTKWTNNLYQDVTCERRPVDAHAVVGDPRLVAPGTATGLDQASGYELLAGSPALGTGAVITGNGGRDYFGDPVPAGSPPNIGAYQGPGVVPLGLLGAVTALASAPALAPGCGSIP
ncbi:MAG TPA: right-handed parallel beta-helix repeat-containing protein [Acidimicrobiales bacterium]|nr:right-handed parallel beta-helix repeat-containing protein [Acidimicrobiales bacterium]